MQVAIQVFVGAVLGLVLAGLLVYVVLTRAPRAFVADKLSVGLFSGADEVGELVSGSDGVDEAGPDAGTREEP